MADNDHGAVGAPSSAWSAGRARSSNPAFGIVEREVGRQHLVTTRLEALQGPVPARAVVPGAVDQAEGGHARSVSSEHNPGIEHSPHNAMAEDG